MVRPVPWSAARSTLTCTSRSKPPSRSTPLTPGTPSSSSWRSSAVRRSAVSEPLVSRFTVSTGMSAKSMSLTIGSSTSLGKSTLARSTASRTSRLASSMSLSGTNSTTTDETPSVDVLVSRSMPERVATSRSISCVRMDSMSSGLAPG